MEECAGCHNIKYYLDCQKRNWSHHKHLCKTYADFVTPPKSESNLRHIITLLQNSDKPYFSWVKVIPSDTDILDEQWSDKKRLTFNPGFGAPSYDKGKGGEVTSFTDIFGPNVGGKLFPNIVHVKINGAQLLDHGISMLRDLNDVQETNQCLKNMTNDHSTKELRLGGTGKWR